MYLSLSYGSLTLRRLSVYKFLYQGVRSLCVKAKSVSQGLHVWALFQEILFQPASSSMEVLLKYKHTWLFRRSIAGERPHVQTHNFMENSYTNLNVATYAKHYFFLMIIAVEITNCHHLSYRAASQR